jgi:hypothetical protein
MTTEFRPDRPEPDSPWARYCPEAWPREWLVRGRMPDGFTRPATQDEADLITGRISERLFLWRTGRLTVPSPDARTDAASSGPARDRGRQSAKRGRSAKRNALVERVTGQRQFFEAVAALELSAGRNRGLVLAVDMHKEGPSQLLGSSLGRTVRGQQVDGLTLGWRTGPTRVDRDVCDGASTGRSATVVRSTRTKAIT